jgi:hypothetical protein
VSAANIDDFRKVTLSLKKSIHDEASAKLCLLIMQRLLELGGVIRSIDGVVPGLTMR